MMLNELYQGLFLLIGFLLPASRAFLPFGQKKTRSIGQPHNHHVVFSTPTSTQPFLDAIAELEIPSYAERVFHGRGGAYPGCEHLTLDWFPPVWLMTSFKEVDDDTLELWGSALSDRWQQIAPPDGNPASSFHWVYQCRDQDSPKPYTKCMTTGEIPNPHVITDALHNKYMVHLTKGMNHGLFLDMANGRKWVQENSKDKLILNLFAYTCAFSVAALNGGAIEVVNVDMSKGALKVGQRNHELNNLTSGARFLGHNVFKTWGKIKKLGPYDIVIVDPPSYQKGSFVAAKDYTKLIRRLPDLLELGGYALLCLNAPELDTSFLHQQVVEAAPELEFVSQLKNPPSFPVIDPERGLKVLLYRLPE